jgi:HAD superfamily hydrolase (TIGR01509 family)
MPGLIDQMIEKDLIPSVPFDVIVDSSKVHAIKPEADMYQKATELSGVEPDQILLIDDSRANLMAAERAGWRVMWFDDYRPTESVEKARNTLAF